MTHSVCILGIFVADLTFVAPGDLPRPGETVLGKDFRIGPGGKGSNQAIAARRAGAEVVLIAKIGNDTFGNMAHELYATEGVSDNALIESKTQPTGAAGIFVSENSGENTIIVTPAAAGAITVSEVEAAAEDIAASSVFLTQFEVPLTVAEIGLRLAHEARVLTILNPAPAATVAPALWPFVDIATPNQSEAEALSGQSVRGPEDAGVAARFFLDQGVGAVAITLGADGAYLMSDTHAEHIPALHAGAIVETTGAGDSFNGAMAAALAEGQPLRDAVRLGNAAGAISITRAGTAMSMPKRAEIDRLLQQT
jgi:ribokinase